MDIKWIEMDDSIKRDYNKKVWIPLRQSHSENNGEYGFDNSTRHYKGVVSLIIPNKQKEEALKISWSDVARHSDVKPDVWGEVYKEASFFEENDIKGNYLILEQYIEFDRKRVWFPHQDLILSLELIQEGDVWIRPKDEYGDVLRLKRSDDGTPYLFEIKNEYLKDYLCARNCGLLLLSFEHREFFNINLIQSNWNKLSCSKKIENGRWEGRINEIHEGGMPFGEKVAVFHMARTDVNFNDDVPELKGSPTDENTKSDSWEVEYSGPKLYYYSGELWKNEWLYPAEISPKVREDEFRSETYFKINSEGKSKNADDLSEDDGWLWFKSDLINTLLNKRNPFIKWGTENTGRVGSSWNQSINFGMNDLGLINIFADDIKFLYEHNKKIWASFNVSPEGGVCKELLMSQVEAEPAKTKAPEMLLFGLSELLDITFFRKFGFKLFRKDSIKDNIHLKIHRFVANNNEGIYKLASELNKYLFERIDIDNLKKLNPINEKLSSIKRIEYILNKLEFNGRKMTSIFVGLYGLRIADAHISSSNLSESLELAGITLDKPFPIIGKQLIKNTVYCINEIGRSIDELSSEFIKQKLPTVDLQ